MANFISGIILLFERPIRVGDVVTIEATNGKASRIRIRATTITNWEKQELLILNKEFITGRAVREPYCGNFGRVPIRFTIGITQRSCRRTPWNSALTYQLTE